jgi:enamine deaminase RidA (YjgF/YER057c/UK114 family)
MSIEKINPSGLMEPVGYSHVVVATGTKRVYVAGQTGVGPDGAVVGADLASQTAQALRNVGTALEAGGATWDDVAKMTILVVGFEPSMAEALFTGVGEVFGEAMPVPATTLHGVQSLFEPEFLVEIEATAEL